MEVTALSVGKSVLSGVLGYAKSALAEEVALQLCVEQDQAFIVDELEMMQSFMMEAHEERADSKVGKTWVKQVRDTAYDVEDCLQDFAVRLDRPSWWLFPCTLLERRRVAKQMKQLRAKVEDVSKRNVRYGLIKGSGSKAAAAAGQSNLAAAAIFGVDDARHAARQKNERVDLVQLINKEDEDLKVISVWGTSGDIGQTSVIRAAYENQDVQSNFPGRAWVRVMHPFNPKCFLHSIVNQFHAAEGFEDLLETEKTALDLAHEFIEIVNEKRCLIVLNDLSTIEEWDLIKKFLGNTEKGSRIIVSTAQVEVASLCAGQESQASELKQLSADQTLYAFYDKGSQNRKDSVKPVSSSDMATTSTKDHTLAPSEIAEDHSKDADEAKGSKNRKDSMKLVSSSDMATTRSKDHTLAPSEITEDHSKDADSSVGALEESQLIGREKEISEITELVSNKASQQGPVISVWGMGGLGKTTLVNGVYQNPKLSGIFEKRAFVTIKRPFNSADFFRSLVAQLQEESPKKDELLKNRASKSKSLGMMGFEELTKELKSHLAKSSLIVLDDLLSTTEWDEIIHWMGKTTQIIVTTRGKDIAEHCSGKYGIVHDLKVLNEEDALKLFSQKVFGKATDLVAKNPELVEEANKILKKCGGLPLAIVTIGGYLANHTKAKDEWRKLNENISAELEMNPELGTIRTVLEKSYDGLPYHLKSCFLYISIFPEDHIISQRRLVRRWTAEGYSSERRGKSANEMAEKYFTELKNRSMILPSQQSIHSRKSTDSCKVHDLIRDIAISKSMEENLVFRLEEGCDLSTQGVIRHLTISSNWKGDPSEFESIVDLSRIRSLSVFGFCEPFYISDKMRFLRVLDLEGSHGLQYHHLDHIWKLLHLKYLSLRGCDGIDLLPDSLGNLRQLQVLDVRATRVMALPKTIIKLRKLQYIHAGRKPDFITDNKKSLMQRSLEGACLCATCCVSILCRIDGPFHKALTRHDACNYACCVAFPAFVTGVIEERGAMVPRGIRKLKDLHTFREVNVGRGNAILQDIKMLTGLRKLGVSGINRKNAQAFCSAISNLRKLESLSVSSAGNPGLRGCLDNISSPPENLQSLKLYGNLKMLPEWMKELPHLVKLKLEDTMLVEHDAAMEFLGRLHKLEILSLHWLAFRTAELRFQSQAQETGIAFRSLRVLIFGKMWKIKSVKFEEGAMPKLERLQVDSYIRFAGLGFLKCIIEVNGQVWDEKRIATAHDSETRDKIIQEEEQEASHKDEGK